MTGRRRIRFATLLAVLAWLTWLLALAFIDDGAVPTFGILAVSTALFLISARLRRGHVPKPEPHFAGVPVTAATPAIVAEARFLSGHGRDYGRPASEIRAARRWLTQLSHLTDGKKP